MLNDSIDNLRIDINGESVRSAIYCRYGDTKTRTVHCTLVDHGNVVPLDNAEIVEIMIAKADGNECDQGCVISGNEIQYTWRTQDLTAEGENKCQFQVTFSDGSLLTSPKFSLFVYKKVLNQKSQTSLNEYTALTQWVVKANEATKEIEADMQVTDENAAKAAASATEAATKAKEAETARDEVKGQLNTMGYAYFTISENGHLILTKQDTLNNILNFSIKDNKRLEATIE